MNRREVAHRSFSFEINEANYKVEGGRGEEKKPNYVLLPTGVFANRIFFVGTLIETEVRENGIKAYLSDPTGTLNVFSGKFTPEATSFLSNVEFPCYCAMVAKLGVFQTSDGANIISVRPERIGKSSEALRDYWILTTAKHTLERLDAIKAAKESGSSIKGINEALEHYDIDLERYYNMVFSAIKYLIPASGERVVENEVMGSEEKEKGEEKEKIRKKLIEVLQTHEDGMSYEDLVKEIKESDEGSIEETLNRLMGEGLVYEPVLGKIKLI